MTETFTIGLPKEILAQLGIKPGDKYMVNHTEKHIYIFEEQNDPHD